MVILSGVLHLTSVRLTLKTQALMCAAKEMKTIELADNDQYHLEDASFLVENNGTSLRH